MDKIDNLIAFSTGFNQNGYELDQHDIAIVIYH